MIRKVFEDYTYTEEIKVKKTIKEEIEEVYYDKIARSEMVYEPPTGVTHCLHCGDRLIDSMWSYTTSNGKYLCPDCWFNKTTSSQKDRYREKAQKMSQGGYSYKTVYDSKRKTRTITKDKEIEIDETVTQNGHRLVIPFEIKYDINNEINKHNVKIDILGNYYKNRSFFPQKYISDEKIENDSVWYNASSYSEAISKLHRIYHKDKVKIFNIGNIPYNEIIVDEKQVLKEFLDVVGFYPNVPAYIQGHPLNMYNNHRTNEVSIDKIITFYCNLSINSHLDYGHYKNRGIIIYSLIDYLLEKDFKISLILLDATFIEGETIIQEFEPQIFSKISNENPNYTSLFEEQTKKLDFLYNMITNIYFYRVLLLENKTNIIKKSKLSEKWNDGFGYYLKNEDLRNICGLGDETIIFGDPSEHGISGLYLDDDFINTMESIGSDSKLIDQDSSEVYSKTSEIPVKKVIKNRNITKLIHVTAEENIPSIKEIGLLPKIDLENKNVKFHQNDYLRLDKHKDAICLSVSEPNDFLFREFTHRNPNIKYKVIEINPVILFEKDENKQEIEKIYSDYNAASRFSKKSCSDMEIMFQDRLRRKAKIHTRDNLESYNPTSGQAEILYFGSIDPKYFLNIYDYTVKPDKFHINDSEFKNKKRRIYETTTDK
ncbi:MAG: DUF4433 domain-containing protein [Acholeplasmatales bacterium]|jgi:hypothetical protein|nr:DUF4433 domain-containing protein [Acholeplasmatales bacterium]